MMTERDLEKLRETMPRYQSHKVVQAVRIHQVQRELGWATVVPADPTVPQFIVGLEYLAKHDPQPGGYFVLYEDGYASWSPAAAFEGGYTRLQ